MCIKPRVHGPTCVWGHVGARCMRRLTGRLGHVQVQVRVHGGAVALCMGPHVCMGLRARGLTWGYVCVG